MIIAITINLLDGELFHSDLLERSSCPHLLLLEQLTHAALELYFYFFSQTLGHLP